MKLLIPAIALLSTTAMAADLKWGVEGRFDYANSQVKHEFTDTTKNYTEKRSEFDSNIIRLNATYTINESLSGRFRYRFSTAQGDDNGTSTKQRDLTFGNVDFFFVDHKNQWFTSRIGKHNQVESLGREFFAAGTDYSTTAYNSVSNKTGYTASNTAVMNTVNNDIGLYHVGYSAIYTGLEGQTFTVSTFNPEKATKYTDVASSSPAHDASNNKFAFGFYYSGTFMDGLIQPTLGYTTASVTSSATTNAGSNRLMSAGVRSSVAGFVVDADWKQYKRDNKVINLINPATDNGEDKTTSVYANVAYTWDMLTPFVNYINDKFTPVGTNFDSYKRNAFTVGLQVKPFKDNNFRYHVAWTNDVKKVTTGSTNASPAETKVTANQFIAGIKFDL